MENLPVEDIALLMILAGPAGSGKTTLCERIVADKNRIERLVTCTTRQPRENEIDGVDYHFLSNEAFDEKIETGAFLEWAKVMSEITEQYLSNLMLVYCLSLVIILHGNLLT